MRDGDVSPGVVDWFGGLGFFGGVGWEVEGTGGTVDPGTVSTGIFERLGPSKP